MSRVVGWLGPFNLTTCKNRLFIAMHSFPTPVVKQRIPYSFFSSRHVDRADTSFQTFVKCQLTDSIASCGVDEVATCRAELGFERACPPPESWQEPDITIRKPPLRSHLAKQKVRSDERRVGTEGARRGRLRV